MALKNTKIIRKITQTCNRFLSGKSDIPTAQKAQEPTENIKGNLKKIRYNVSNTTKSSLFPRVNLAVREPEQTELFEINHLQPSTYPKYIKVNLNYGDKDVWQLHERRRKLNIQYPSATAVEDCQKSSLVTDTIKGNLFKGPTNLFGNKNYSTSPFVIASKRYYMRKRSKEGEKCPQKSKKRCRQGPCPKIPVENCDKSPGSHCEHFYIENKCKKKMAPYPSYSETCARELEDNPSECYQCPWEKCGGVNAIKPPKKQYHTAASHHMSTIPGQFIPLSKECLEKKKPCKVPPPKCQKEKKKPGCPGQPKKPKKCTMSWSEAYSLWFAKENLIPSVDFEYIEVKRDEKDVRNKFPYDKRQADYEYVRRNPCPDEGGKCKRKKFKTVPDGCEPNPYRRCMPDVENIVLELTDCPKRRSGNDCPKTRGGRRKKCPNTYRPIDVTLELLKEHDKGHPPPCPDKTKPSQPCPKKKKKDPFKREREMFEPFYRQNPKPYPPFPER